MQSVELFYTTTGNDELISAMISNEGNTYCCLHLYLHVISML